MKVPIEVLKASVIDMTIIREWSEATPGTFIDDGFDLILKGEGYEAVPRVQHGTTRFRLELRTYDTEPPEKHHVLISHQDSKWSAPHQESFIGCSPEEVEQGIQSIMGSFRQDPYKYYHHETSPAHMGLYL